MIVLFHDKVYAVKGFKDMTIQSLLSQDMRCHKDEAFMECKPDPAMQMTGVLSENAGANPPPFFCGPKQYFPL